MKLTSISLNNFQLEANQKSVTIYKYTVQKQSRAGIQINLIKDIQKLLTDVYT